MTRMRGIAALMVTLTLPFVLDAASDPTVDIPYIKCLYWRKRGYKGVLHNVKIRSESIHGVFRDDEITKQSMDVYFNNIDHARTVFHYDEPILELHNTKGQHLTLFLGNHSKHNYSRILYTDEEAAFLKSKMTELFVNNDTEKRWDMTKYDSVKQFKCVIVDGTRTTNTVHKMVFKEGQMFLEYKLRDIEEPEYSKGKLIKRIISGEYLKFEYSSSGHLFHHLTTYSPEGIKIKISEHSEDTIMEIKKLALIEHEKFETRKQTVINFCKDWGWGIVNNVKRNTYTAGTWKEDPRAKIDLKVGEEESYLEIHQQIAVGSEEWTLLTKPLINKITVRVKEKSNMIYIYSSKIETQLLCTNDKEFDDFVRKLESVNEKFRKLIIHRRDNILFLNPKDEGEDNGDALKECIQVFGIEEMARVQALENQGCCVIS